jgi:MFS transporter, putative metabolite:H+ symporter
MAEAVSIAAGSVAASAARDSIAGQREIAARLERLPMGGLRTKARLIVGTATFFDGFDAISIAQAMPVLVGLWKLSPGDVGLLISAGFFGQCIGAFCIPWLAERMGRLRMMTFTIALFGIASLACGFTWDFHSMAVARFVQGLGLGGEVSCAATYINEIARSRGRGRFFLLYEMVFGIGAFIAGILGSWVVPSFGWQWIFFIGALPAFLALVLRLVLPESPRWLAAHGRFAEADAIVAGMERDAVARTGTPLPAADPMSIPPPVAQKTNWREVLAPLYRRRTLVIWSVWFCAFFVSQGVNSWLPTLYRTLLHTDVRTALQYGYIATGMSLTGNIVAATIIDWMGRPRYMAMALPLGGLPLLILAYVGLHSEHGLLIAASLSYMWTGSISIVLYLYTPELYPTRMRAMGCGFGATWRNVATTTSPLLIGYVLGSFGVNYVFLMLGSVPFIAMIIILFFGTETTGRVLEEVSR